MSSIVSRPIRWMGLVSVVWATSTLSGCEALSPRQLWKLNRQPAMDRGDAYFSVPCGEASGLTSQTLGKTDHSP